MDIDGHSRSVKDALCDAVASLQTELQAMAAGSDTVVPIGKSARDLLEALRETDTA